MSNLMGFTKTPCQGTQPLQNEKEKKKHTEMQEQDRTV